MFEPFMAQHGLYCAQVPLRNNSLTHSLQSENYYLRQRGYVFARLFVCLSVCLSVCLLAR